MKNRISLVLLAIATGLFLISYFFIAPQNSFAYNKPWDQGHDSTNPIDPKDKEEPPKPQCDECEQQKDCYLCPVSSLGGNYIHRALDLFVSGPLAMELTRTYNSNDNLRSGLFGNQWSTVIDMKMLHIAATSGQTVKVLMGNGQRLVFTVSGQGTYTAPLGQSYTLSRSTDGHFLLRRKSSLTITYEFDSEGRLAAIFDRNLNRTSIFYVDGCPNVMTDQDGRTINFVKGPNGKIAGVVDYAGRRLAYSYDSKGNLLSVSDPLGKSTTYTYDANNNLTQIVDAVGKTVASISYSTNGKVSRLIDKEGDYSFTYLSSTQTRKVETSSGAIWTFAHDANGVVTAVTDPLGRRKANVLDADYNLSNETDALGNKTSFTFDSLGRKLTKTDALGSMWRYAYVGDTYLLATETDPMGAVTRYEYDARGNRIGLIRDSGGPSQSRWEFTYDAKGHRTSAKDPIGNTTTYVYSETGNLLQVINPLGASVGFVYDDRGNMVSETDANGNTTTHTYDLKDRKLTSTDALGNVVRYAFDAAGNRVSTTDPLGNVTTYGYDAYGRLIQQTDPNGNTVAQTYDARGNLTSITDPLGGITRFAYDNFGNRTSKTDPLGKVTSYVYNANNQLIRKTDANGLVTQYVYDALKRLQSVTDPAGKSTAYRYDAGGNLIALTDANGNVNGFEYDRLQRLIRTVRPLLQEENYAYDATGKLIRKIDTKGQRVDYAYDGAGRITEARFYGGANAATLVKTVQLAFDSARNLLGYADGTTTGSFGYDALNRKSSETIDYGAFALTNTYAYNANSMLAGFVGPDGIAYQYTYDKNNQITRVTIPNIGDVNLGGYRWFRPTTVSLPGGVSRQITHDALLRINAIDVNNPGGNELLKYSYIYDAVGNITRKTTEHGAYVYTYDALYRLTGADNPVQPDEAYTYDGVGNRLTSAEYGNWYYNANNELQGYDTVGFTYDANGNTIEKNDNGIVTRYFYNVEDRLERVENGSKTVIARYYYDPFGRRLWKDVAGTRTYFVYSNGGLIAEADGSGTVTKSYGYKPGSTWTTDPLFVREAGQYYFYQNDHLGTPQKISSLSGAVVWSAKSSAFGEAEIDPASTVTNHLRLPGQYYDGETELYYNWHRYYDPEVGRFTAKDPISFAGGHTNLYGYVKNDPVNFIDPEGLEIRVYSSNAFGVSGLNHAFVYSTETARGKGTEGSSWVTLGNGVGDLNSPYIVVSLPPGMSESDFMNRIENAKGWNNWVWLPWVNDCHSDLENAFNQADVPYSGAPNGRMDIDDNIINAVRNAIDNIMRQLNQLNNPFYIYRLHRGY